MGYQCLIRMMLHPFMMSIGRRFYDLFHRTSTIVQRLRIPNYHGVGQNLLNQICVNLSGFEIPVEWDERIDAFWTHHRRESTFIPRNGKGAYSMTVYLIEESL